MKHQLALIAAIAANNVIGKNGSLAWYLPADLKRFKELTTGHTIVMGRQTYETCVKRVLPNRKNIIVSHNPHLRVEGALVAGSLAEVLEKADSGIVFIIGGATIYEQALPLVAVMYITEVHAAIEGNVFFPLYDKHEWEEVASEDHAADDKNRFDYTFKTYQRKKKVLPI